MLDAVKLGADAVGAIPHFEFTREYSVESLNFALELAAKEGKLVDVHCGFGGVGGNELIGVHDLLIAHHLADMKAHKDHIPHTPCTHGVPGVENIVVAEGDIDVYIQRGV